MPSNEPPGAHVPADRSRPFRSWAIGLMAGTAVLAAILETPQYFWTIMLPIPALAILDAWSLARDGKPGNGGNAVRETLRALASPGIRGFYLPMEAMAAILWAIAR